MKTTQALRLCAVLALVHSTPAIADEAVSAPVATQAGAPDPAQFFVERKRVNFRAGVIGWIYARNNAVGWVSDFTLPGSELPVHLDLDPADKQVVLEWKLRFR